MPVAAGTRGQAWLVRLLAAAALGVAAAGGEPAATTAPAASAPGAPAPGAGEPGASSAPASAPTPLPGPKYQPMRWNEDFSYLDGPPGSYQADFFDPIKNIRFGDDWRMILGGSLRARVESRTNKNINQADPTQDTVVLQRYLLHMDVRYRKLLRFFFEGIHAPIDDNDSVFSSGDENRFDFNQYFADVRILGEDVPLTFRAGRQEVQYGRGRVIASPEWSNNKRRFDGFKLYWRSDAWDVDAFYLRPVPDAGMASPEDSLDRYDTGQYLVGTYAAYKGIPDHELDLYYLYYRNTNDPTSADGSVGSINLNVLGTRLGGAAGPWDYDTELTGQFGEFAGETIQAWSWAIDGGYTLEETDWKPRLGAGFELDTGDSNPNDGKHQRYNLLFTSGHSFLGDIDIVGRQNVAAGNVNLTVQPAKNVKSRVTYYAFWLAEAEDALFSKSGGTLRRDPTGSSGKEVGQELDFVIDFKLDTHSSLLLGWAHFWTGDFIDNTGLGDDADFIYLQYIIRF